MKHVKPKAVKIDKRLFSFRIGDLYIPLERYSLKHDLTMSQVIRRAIKKLINEEH